MDCPKCGYAMSPFDADRPRCKRMAAEGKTPAAAPTQQGPQQPAQWAAAPRAEASPPAPQYEGLLRTGTVIGSALAGGAVGNLFVRSLQVCFGGGAKDSLYGAVVGLLLGLALGCMVAPPDVRRRISILVLVFGGVGFLSVLVLMLGSHGPERSVMAGRRLVELLALAAMLVGGVGLRARAPWAALVLYGAAAAWLLTNADLLPSLTYRVTLFSPLRWLSLAAGILGIPLLAVCAGLACRTDDRDG
jgi:hypothetical protein